MGLDDFFGAAKGILAAVAPTVATAFGGPLAGMATQRIISALGMNPDATQEDVMKAVSGATPEQLLQLKKLEQDFKLEMERLGIEADKLVYQDRDSARNREIKTGDSWTPRIIAGVIMLLYVWVQYYLLNFVIEPSMREIVMRSLGTLDAAVGLVLGYYFGSSLGSHQKNDHVSALLDQQKK